MNDFSELEKDLKALRPARPSPVLFERIEGAMAENCQGAGVRRQANSQLVLAFHRSALQIWYRPCSSGCGGRSVNRANQHRSNAKRKHRNRASFTTVSDKTGPAFLFW